MLTVTERLRKQGVVGKFVEFFGPGLEHLTIADRATLGNMCPEYGATMAIFPIDEMTLDYLRLTGREEARVRLVEAYAKAQGLFRQAALLTPCIRRRSSSTLTTVEPSLAGPRRPQDRVSLNQAKKGFQAALANLQARSEEGRLGAARRPRRCPALQSRSRSPRRRLRARSRRRRDCRHHELHEHVQSECDDRPPDCWQERLSNAASTQALGQEQPGAGVEGCDRIPGAAGLMRYLDELGFNLVGYGCTTCIGNSGPLPDDVAAEVESRNLVVASVLSGNRNFEGRIQQQVRANYLASPPLVVAYAHRGTHDARPDDRTARHGQRRDAGLPARDLADRARDPGNDAARGQRGDVPRAVRGRVQRRRAVAFYRRAGGRSIRVGSGIHLHPQAAVFRGPDAASRRRSPDIAHARALAVLGDSVTTDHISPAGSIKQDSPAGKYLIAHGVSRPTSTGTAHAAAITK